MFPELINNIIGSNDVHDNKDILKIPDNVQLIKPLFKIIPR